MKVLHVMATLRTADGGGVKGVTELTQSQAKKGIDVTIFAPSWSDIDACTSSPEGVEVKFFKRTILSKLWFGHSRILAETLRKEYPRFDLIHAHHIWCYPQFAVYETLKSKNKPYVLSIHGELFPHPSKNRSFQKKFFYELLQKKVIKNAAAVHAVSENEARHIANLVNHPDIFFIPNGINPEEFKGPSDAGWIRQAYPQLAGKKTILFLGRIFPGKGLDVLVRAFSRIARIRSDVYLLIAGPDNWGYKNELEEMLDREAIPERVIFTGMLIGDKKKAAFSCADLFVYPSYSEGFSNAVLEAMAWGLPVIISPQCNFPEVQTRGAGRVIEPEVGQLEKVISGLLDQPEICRQMGDRGRALVNDQYTWDKIAENMIAAYERIINASRN